MFYGCCRLTQDVRAPVGHWSNGLLPSPGCPGAADQRHAVPSGRVDPETGEGGLGTPVRRQTPRVSNETETTDWESVPQASGEDRTTEAVDKEAKQWRLSWKISRETPSLRISDGIRSQRNISCDDSWIGLLQKRCTLLKTIYTTRTSSFNTTQYQYQYDDQVYAPHFPIEILSMDRGFNRK